MRKRPFWTIERRDGLAGYLFIAPQLIGIIVFVLLPLGLVVYYSLHEWNVLAGTFRFVGDANYQKLLSDPALPEVRWTRLVRQLGGLAKVDRLVSTPPIAPSFLP